MITPGTVEAMLLAAGLSIESSRAIDHAVQFRVTDGEARATVNLYTSGRLLVQGGAAGLNERITALLAPGATPPKARRKTSATASAELPAGLAGPRIGMDESGKGDYFGPLVVASAFVKPSDEPWLAELGVRDCKQLDDRTVVRLAAALRKAIPCEVVVFLPPKYNALYPKFGNLNALLAWGHARALESLLSRVECGLAVADKFADARVLERALGERGRALRLVQAVRAEADPAVAAASVLARGEFLRRLAALGKAADLKLPPGAGPPVEDAARRLAASGGREALAAVAKLHFKTTGKVLGEETGPWI